MGVRCSGLESISRKRHKVQLRASKIFEGFCNISHEERLKRLNIIYLKDREALKSSARNTFASSVTQRHNFFTNRVTPRRN